MGGMTKLEPTAQQTAIPGIDDSVEPGVWRYVHASRARVIVDAADYFAIMQAAMLNARYRIFLIGWDFDTRIHLAEGRHWWQRELWRPAAARRV